MSKYRVMGNEFCSMAQGVCSHFLMVDTAVHATSNNVRQGFWAHTFYAALSNCSDFTSFTWVCKCGFYLGPNRSKHLVQAPSRGVAASATSSRSLRRRVKRFLLRRLSQKATQLSRPKEHRDFCVRGYLDKHDMDLCCLQGDVLLLYSPCHLLQWAYIKVNEVIMGALWGICNFIWKPYRVLYTNQQKNLKLKHMNKHLLWVSLSTAWLQSNKIGHPNESKWIKTLFVLRYLQEYKQITE